MRSQLQQAADVAGDISGAAWSKVIASVLLTASNFIGSVTLDGTYKVALLLLAGANLVWAVLNIRKLLRESK